MKRNQQPGYEQDIEYRGPSTKNSSKKGSKYSIPYVLPYLILLVFNGLLFAVNQIYYDLKNGAWSPPTFAAQPQNLKQRPYQLIVYILNAVATLIFFFFMMYPGHQRAFRSEKAMIARWFSHLIAISLIVMIWILDSSHLWVYKISLKDIAFNSNWNDPLYTFMYALTVVYGLLLAFPFSIYLLYKYFIRTEDNYKLTQEAVQYHKNHNKVFYFATYISIIVVIGLNLAYLNDYQTYLVEVIYQKYIYFPNLQTQMLLPVLYVEYILSGTSMLFASFLLIKEIFDTMKDKRKHIKRQLIILTAVMFMVDLLTLNRFIQVNRYEKVVRDTKLQPNQPFLDLYYHLRVVMWCYIFLLFPLNIYSIRNLWLEWKNQFSKGDLSQIRGSQYNVTQEPLGNNNSRQRYNQGPRYQEDNRYPNEERLKINTGSAPYSERPPSQRNQRGYYVPPQQQYQQQQQPQQQPQYQQQQQQPRRSQYQQQQPQPQYQPQQPPNQVFVIPIPKQQPVEVKVGVERKPESQVQIDLRI